MTLKSALFILCALLSSNVSFAHETNPSPCESVLLSTLDKKFVALHSKKEWSFWASRMGHSGYVEGSYEKADGELQDYITDRSNVPVLEKELERTDLSPRTREGLTGWLQFFKANSTDPSTLENMKKLAELEAALAKKKKEFQPAYFNEPKGEIVSATLSELPLVILNNQSEESRKSAFESLRLYEQKILTSGFIDVIKMRREVARSAGFKDFYDWKLSREGLTKEDLFKQLDALEMQTRESIQSAKEAVAKEKGPEVLKPWNYAFMTAGSLREKKNPYLQIENSLEQWVRMFAAMGIEYHGATLHIDIMDRSTKYSNGFMHGPIPGYIHTDGKFHPATINFSANAVNQVGGGERALTTFIHEGGHAAHFSGILMAGAAYAQEFAPSSIASMETQSMFLDSLLRSPEWLARYARTIEGKPIPEELIKEATLESQKHLAQEIRQKLVVPYFEKAIYEMSDEELTPENITKVAREVEQRLLLADSQRPVISIPHILSNVSSAYCHGYILAEMAVYQTTSYFMKKYGYIIDNPRVGQDLALHYWAPGNSRTFVQLVKDLTSEDFSAKAIIAAINRTPEQTSKEVDQALENEKHLIPHHTGSLELNAHIYIVHGDELITSNEGRPIKAMFPDFVNWIQRLKK